MQSRTAVASKTSVGDEFVIGFSAGLLMTKLQALMTYH